MPTNDPHVTRREFVKSSAAVAAGGIVFAASPMRAETPGSESRATSGFGANDPIKVAVIGCGGRGSGAALDAIGADANVIIWSVADVFPDRLANGLKNVKAEVESRVQAGTLPKTALDQVQVPDARQFTGFDGYQKAIVECDAVILATPPHFRPAQLKAAVDANKHVFCEKPVAVDGPGVRSVMESVKAAEAKNLSIVSGFCWRYSTREREAYQLVHDGAIGDIRAVYTTYNATGWVRPQTRQPQWTEMESQLRSWHYYPWLSGDHLVEQAVHSIDKMAWAMRDVPPVQCTAVGGRQCRDQVGEPGCVFDHFAVTFEYASGVRGFHMCRHFPSSPSDNSDTIIGTSGICRVSGFTNLHEITGAKPWKCRSAANDMYLQEHIEFFQSLRSGTPINDGERMTSSTLMAIMGRMAAYTAQNITWEQALNSTEELKPTAYDMSAAPPACEQARPGLTKFA